jgi:hypothetical protein
MSDLKESERILRFARAIASPECASNRAAVVLRLFKDSLPYPNIETVAILDAAYGDAAGGDYWAAWTARRVSAYDFSEFLAVHSLKMTGRFPVDDIGSNKIADISHEQSRVLECLLKTDDDGVWLTAGGAPPSVDDVRQKILFGTRFRKLQIKPRRAIDWMMQDPSSRAFVPSSYSDRASEMPVAGAPTGRGSPQATIVNNYLADNFPDGIPLKGVPYKKISTHTGVSKTVVVEAVKKKRDAQSN